MKITTQSELEFEQQTTGFDRKQKASERLASSGHSSHNPAEFRLLTGNLGVVSDAIKKRILEYEKIQANRRPPVANLLGRIGPDQAALIAQQQILNVLHKGLTLQSVAMKIGSAIRVEWQAKMLRQQKPWAWKFWVSTGRIGVTSSATQVRRALKHVKLDLEPFTSADCVKLGVELLGIVRSQTGFVDVSKVDGRKTQYVVIPSATAVDWLNAQNESDWASHPIHMPTVEPPRDWVSLTEGGYRHIAVDLVTGVSPGWIDSQKSRDLSEVLNAVNSLQRTPWRINEDVLTVMEAAFIEGWEVGKMPTFDEESLPPAPVPFVHGSPEVKDWKMNAAKTHERNRRNRSKRFQTAEALRIARLLRDEPAIYFVWVLDFRGRMYTRCSAISPQASDAQRSLLAFAEAKPLKTKASWDWLKIHGANSAGLDKKSFTERIAFVDQNDHVIQSIAADPLTDRRWSDGWDSCPEVDKPWAFLAFCLDFANALETGSSSIPVAQDAVCSGLQIYSALLLDEEGARGTALVPGEQPSDIYSDVAAKLKDRVSAEAQTESMAREWLASGLIGRALTKSPTMTLSYGVTAQGIYDQTRDTVEGWRVAAAKAGRELPFANSIKATGWIVERLKTTLGETITSAFDAMQALRQASRVLARRGTHAQWVTPTNWHVQQNYTVQRSTRIRTNLFGSVSRLYIGGDEGQQPNSRRSINGISPNVIHSLDASLLVRTVNAVESNSETPVSFAMIHDSFAVHAADCDQLAKHTREQFVLLFTPDVLRGILNQLLKLAGPNPPDDWPETPDRGAFELNQVVESPYFFS